MVKVLDYRTCNSPIVKAEFYIELFGSIKISRVRLYQINGFYSVSLPFWRDKDGIKHHYVTISNKDIYNMVIQQIIQYYKNQMAMKDIINTEIPSLRDLNQQLNKTSTNDRNM